MSKIENQNSTGLSPSLKKHLREITEDSLFSKHKEFYRCANHLYEFSWLTENEFDAQHEYYPYHETLLERIYHFFTPKIRVKVPDTPEVTNYVAQLREEISADIEKRLKVEQAIMEKRGDRIRLQDRNRVEEEAFRRTHPDYKLYENHIGQTRWMTQAEFDQQEEFTDEVIPLSRRILRYAAVFIAMVALIAIGYFVIRPYYFEDSPKGFLLVETNEPHGRLYVNQILKIGYSPLRPLSLQPGDYEITYTKPGFAATPLSQSVTVIFGDTARVSFYMEKRDNNTSAVLSLSSSFPDAKVFVGNDFHGYAKDNTQMILTPGTYRIALKKEGYTASPPFINVTLAPNQPTDLKFDFIPLTGSRERETSNKNGLLEISSNIADAAIFLDGKDTGLKTDYVFYKVPFGDHIISVKKEGFLSEPLSKEIRLSAQNAQQTHHFTLSRTDITISFKTVPVEGKIFLDGKELGSGEWNGALPPGKYKVSFGAVDYYRIPDPQYIEIKNGSDFAYEFKYTSQFSLTFTSEQIYPRNEAGNIQLGYLDEDQTFHSDPGNAPEIRRVKELDDAVWMLGYAFAYRNPPLNDAIVFTFNVPQTVELKDNIWLKVWGYQTDEKYPLEFTGISRINIMINNRSIQLDFPPTYMLSAAGPERYEQFRINNLLRHGKNRLQISTSPLNTIFFALWKVTIE